MKKYLAVLVVLVAIFGWLGHEFSEMIYAQPPVQAAADAAGTKENAAADMQAATAAKTTLTVSVQGTDTMLHGTWDATPLAQEIKGHLPFEVHLVNWHGREFYGSLGWQPKGTGESHRTFEEGDVTYCPQNNSIAIFYDKSREPNLTMDVIVIGHIDAADLPKLHGLGEDVTMLLD